MPPKYKVSREEILQAAYGLLEARGKNAVTTRAIAEKLGVSTRPIYSFFPSMETLFHELILESNRIMRSYMQREYTADPFLNMGVGFVCFYREKMNVAEFHESRWTESTVTEADKIMFGEFYESIRNKEVYRGITRDELFAIYRQMSIFTFGLVKYLKASGTELTVPETIEWLDEVGEAMIVHHLWKKNGKPGAKK